LYLQERSSISFLSLLFNLVRQDNLGKWIKQYICYTLLTLGASPSLTTKIKAQGKDL
jgi:transposase-like protein